MLVLIAILFVITTSYATNSSNSSGLFPHLQFDCDPSKTDVYETEFIFLQGLGHGFVHAESNRVFFEYYFPVEHWVAFATADQIIVGEQDHCSKCYFDNYYPSSPTNKNHSNLYPNCIKECLEDTIFVGSVNSDEENINTWDIIEFQITSQTSKKLGKKMYRIPTFSEILEIWGSTNYPYRMDADFDINITQINLGQEWKQFVHASFWRDYDFQSDQNEWKPFVNTSNSDSFCFISISSFNGGAYPYDDDALNGMLPGFYIDTEHFANIHCYKANDIKVNCGGKTFQDSADSIEELESYDDSDDTNNDTDAYTDTLQYEQNEYSDGTGEDTNFELYKKKKIDLDGDTLQYEPYIDYKGERKSNVLLEYIKKVIGADGVLFTTTYESGLIDDPYDVPYEDPSTTVNYEYALAIILKIVAVIIVIMFCVCFCCMNKRRQRSMNILQRVEYDEFNEGLVDDDVSTLVVIGQQT